MPRARISQSQSGFTLIESMIAMFFLAFMVAELGSVMAYASLNSNLTQRITRANTIADLAVEQSRNTDYDSLQIPSAALGEECVTTAYVARCTSRQDADRFTVVRTIRPIAVDYATTPPTVTTKALGESNHVEIQVTVSFTDARGSAQSISVTSVVSRVY